MRGEEMAENDTEMPKVGNIGKIPRAWGMKTNANCKLKNAN